jgi:hypothetical protein
MIVPRRATWTTAMMMPAAKLNTSADPASNAVFGNARAITVVTGWLNASENPNCPRATPARKRRYCSPIGRSRP